jgi:hypothetical protein
MNRWVQYSLWFLSWVGSASLGVVVGLHHQKFDGTEEMIRAKRIEVVDEAGRPRISLMTDAKAATVEIMTSAGRPQVRLEVSKEQRTDESHTMDEVPSIGLGLDGFPPAVGVYASPRNRGTIVFSNEQRTGKVMLGYFSNSDVEGEDDGIWGLSVSGRVGEHRLDRLQGITSFEGKDTGLIWPSYASDLKRGKQ